MKKLLIFISLIILLSIKETTAKALINNISYKEEGIEENILIEKDEHNNIKKVQDIIDLNKTNNNIIIKPKLFETLNHYKEITRNEKIEIEIIIKNNTQYNYKYLNNSLKITTLNDESESLKNQYKKTGAISFDNKNIISLFVPFRTINNPLKSLINKDIIEEKDLSDREINTKLREIGYLGVSELDKYYLNYINTKYNLRLTNLNELDSNLISEIFTSNLTSIKESNNNIISLAYNNYFNNVLKLNLENTNIIKEKSILEEILINNLFLSNNEEYKLNNLYLIINDENYLDIYNKYNYNLSLELTLIKDSQNDELITPPNTGI